MKKIPFILVGAGNFALQRLKILNETGKFIAVAIVDIDLKKAKKKIVDYDKSLANKVYKNISSAIKDVKAEACILPLVSKCWVKGTWQVEQPFLRLK